MWDLLKQPVAHRFSKGFSFPSFSSFLRKAAMRSTLSIFYLQPKEMKSWKMLEKCYLNCLILCFKKKSTYVFITSHVICFSYKGLQKVSPDSSFLLFWLYLQIPVPSYPNKNSLSRCYVPGTSNEMDKCRHSLCSPKAYSLVRDKNR